MFQLYFSSKLKTPSKTFIINVIKGVSCTPSRDRTGTSVTSLVFETNASTNSAIRAFKELLHKFWKVQI